MKSQLKILLAGFGDIAQRLANRVNEKGIEPVAVKRTPLKNASNVLLRLGDLRDNFFLKTLLFEPFDVLVVSITPEEFSDIGYRDSYVKVAQSLVNEINQASLKPGLVVWVSSTSVFGEGSGEWVNEETAPMPNSFSGKRLLEAESIISTLTVPFTIVRFSGIYGPGRNRMIEQVKGGVVSAATPVVWSNRIHSEDCAAVLEHLIALYQGGQRLAPLYLGTDSESAPIHEVQTWLANQLGVVNQEIKAPPARANRRCSNQRLLASGFEFQYPDYQSGYQQLLLEFIRK